MNPSNYTIYFKLDWQIADNEDSFAIFSKYTFFPRLLSFLAKILTFLVIVLLIVFLVKSGYVVRFANWLITFLTGEVTNYRKQLFVIFFSIIAFAISIILYRKVLPFITFFIFSVTGIFKMFRAKKDWRKRLNFQIIGWKDLVNAHFDKKEEWRNYEVKIELNQSSNYEYFEGKLERDMEEFNTTYYETKLEEKRKKWHLDKNKMVLSGSVNSETTRLLHFFLSVGLTNMDFGISKVTFQGIDDFYCLAQYIEPDSGGGDAGS